MQPHKKNISKLAKKNQDHFSFYAVIMSTLILVALFFYFYQNRALQDVSFHLGYGQLEQTIIEDAGIVARMTAAVQVNKNDLGWLKENEKAIYAAYKKEMETMDLSSFSSKEGFENVQNELKRRLNLIFKTDKIQAVMFTDLVLQHDH